jgi:3-deoxy-D-manno-octulosonic-acid transferase
VDAATADVVIVDRVGVLGDLYALADLAFVGGGFHAAGLHSVLEPAAFGTPVVFGPRHANSRDAGLLLEARAAAVASDTTSLEAALTAWLEDDPARRASGDAARETVRAGLGAAERSFELVASLLR